MSQTYGVERQPNMPTADGKARARVIRLQPKSKKGQVGTMEFNSQAELDSFAKGLARGYCGVYTDPRKSRK